MRRPPALAGLHHADEPAPRPARAQSQLTGATRALSSAGPPVLPRAAPLARRACERPEAGQGARVTASEAATPGASALTAGAARASARRPPPAQRRLPAGEEPSGGGWPFT